jgi:serine/threonine protein kinase
VSERDWTPSDEDLLAFDRGLLPDASADAVARWLEAHPEGEQRIEQLSERCPDGAVEALRQPCRIDAELERLSSVATHVIQRVLAGPGLGAQVQAVGHVSNVPPQAGHVGNVPPQAVPESIRDYRLLGPLGQGGMGQVYRALHTRLQREVALKLLPPHLAADSSYRRRFEREMALVGPLDHPHLVRAHDAGLEGSHLFLVMERLDGIDLARVVSERGPLPVAAACEVVRQAALGLHHAHQHGIVHRDVKPSNLFLTRAGQVKVIDLGLAHTTELRPGTQPLSSALTLVGTPEYMAPEQWLRTEIGPRVDIYNLGCTLFCLLTGRPPFVCVGGKPWVELVDAHRMEPPPPLRRLRRDVPAGLADLVGRMLAKVPSDRPSSALEVAEALAPFAQGHDLASLAACETGPSSASPVALSPGQRGRLSALQRRLALILGAFVAVALAALTIVWWTQFRTGPHAPVTQASTPSLPEQPPADAAPQVLRPALTLAKHTDRVMAVAYSTDGKWLASGGADQTIWLHDTRTWTARGPLQGHSGDVVGLAFSPDGRTLASIGSHAEDCQIRLWDIETGQPAGRLGEANSGNWGLAYSPDGQTLACAGWDRILHIFDAPVRRPRYAIPEVTSRFVRALAISPDGRRIATGGAGPTRLWDAATSEEVPAQLPDWLYPVFLPDGKGLACWTFDAGRITLCELPPGHKRVSWRAHPDKIEGLAVSPDGRFLASVGGDVGKLWRVADQKEVARLVGHQGTVYMACFAPDGKHVATAGFDDSTVRIWNLPEEFHTGAR